MKKEELLELISKSIDDCLDCSNPESICICGSSRFCDIMAVIKWCFEKKGVLAEGLHYLPQWYFEGKPVKSHLAEHEGMAKSLDNLHFKKIDRSDVVFNQ